MPSTKLYKRHFGPCMRQNVFLLCTLRQRKSKSDFVFARYDKESKRVFTNLVINSESIRVIPEVLRLCGAAEVHETELIQNVSWPEGDARC